jgi:hypothetical protein
MEGKSREERVQFAGPISQRPVDVPDPEGSPQAVDTEDEQVGDQKLGTQANQTEFVRLVLAASESAEMDDFLFE